MKVLVCGGRNVGRPSDQVERSLAAREIARAGAERDFVADTLSFLHREKPFSLVIGGEEGGAERLGMQWAQRSCIPTRAFTRKRGLLQTEVIGDRNLRMLLEGKPDLIVCFGEGENTSRMLRSAKSAGIEALLFASLSGSAPSANEQPPTGQFHMEGLARAFTSAAKAR